MRHSMNAPTILLTQCIACLIFTLAPLCVYAEALTGFYAGASLGYGQTSWKSPDFTLKKDPLVYGVGLGFKYAVNHKITVGAGIGYNKDGGVDATKKTDATMKYKMTLNDIALLIGGSYIIDDSINIFAKAGYARVTQKTTTWTKITTPSKPDPKIAYRPKIAIGAGYFLLDTMNAYLQLEHTLGTSDGTNSAQSTRAFSRVMVGITYTVPLYPNPLPASKILSLQY